MLSSPFRFCPYCGHELVWKQPNGDHRPRQVCRACDRILYRNPKPCAGAFIVRDGRLLLLRRSIEPYAGWWDLPGGFMEIDETPEETVLREVREETGLEVRLTGLLGLYLDSYGPEDVTLNIYFLAEPVAGEPRPLSEASEVRWFAPDELPQNVAFPSHSRRALADWAGQIQRL